MVVVLVVVVVVLLLLLLLYSSFLLALRSGLCKHALPFQGRELLDWHVQTLKL